MSPQVCIKSVFLTLLFFLVTLPGIAQPVFEKGHFIPNWPHDGLIDAEGNTIRVSRLADSLDVDHDGIADLFSKGGTDILITSRSPEGILNWFRTAGSNVPGLPTALGIDLPTDVASDVTQDPDGNLYVAGVFYDAVDFDQDSIFDVTTTLPDTSGLFLAKYTHDGSLGWVKSFGKNSEFIMDLQYIPSTNTLYIISKEVRYKVDERGFASIGQYGDISFTEYDVSGTRLREYSFDPYIQDSIGVLVPRQFRIDASNNLYLVGHFNGTVDFDGNGPSAPITAPAVTSPFLGKYSLSGSLQWLRYGAGFVNSLTGILLDQNEGIWISGSYTGEFALITPDSTHVAPGVTLDFRDRNNAFFARYLPDGQLGCSKFVPNQATQSPYKTHLGGAIIQPTASSVIAASSWTGVMDFDDDGVFEVPNQEGTYTVFSSLDYDCSPLWTWASGPKIELLDIYEGSEQYQMQGFSNTNQLFLDGLEDEPPLINVDAPSFRFFSARLENFDGVLPVTLTSFQTLQDGESVTLLWETASEQNNAGFEIQHQYAEELWQAIGFVPGAGTTDEIQTYSFSVDELIPGKHHFRLKQIDFDGAFEYSQERNVEIELSQRYVLSNAFPNPFNPQTAFTLSIAKTQDVRIELYDLTGRLIQTIHEGSLPANTSHTFIIDGSQLSSGVYLYRVTGDGFTSSKPITFIK